MAFPDLTRFFFVILAKSVDTRFVCLLDSWIQVNSLC